MLTLTTLLKTRLRAVRAMRLDDSQVNLVWAVIVGVVGALATLVFRELIRFLELRLGGAGDDPSLVAIARGLPWYWRLALPAAGGLAAGLVLLLAHRFGDQHGADYMETIAIGEGRVPVLDSLLRSVSSLATIVSGGSIGREGSMVQLAALGASIVGRLRHFDPERLRLLVACGAAAGITSAYNAPIAGAFFVTEIVIGGSMDMRRFGPLVVSAVTANILMRALPGYHPTYQMPAFPAIHGAEILVFAALGLGCGLLSPYFLNLLGASRRLFAATRLALPPRLALGGLGVGAISIVMPEVWGNGYDVVSGLLHGHWLWQAVLLVLLLKIAATALTVGSGAVGGIFTPTLFVGAALGELVGLVAHGLWPQGSSEPFAYAIVGMSAFLGAATSAPLMAILMIFEMTLSYEVVLPLLLATVLAHVIARRTEGPAMYSVTIRRERELRERARLRATTMRELIRPAETVVTPDATLEELSRLFLAFPVKYVYVVDAAGRYQGIVALQDLTAHLLERAFEASALRASDLMKANVLPVITPDMSLADALQHFVVHMGERLPAIESRQNPVLLGVVWKTALLDAYFRLDHGGMDLR